MTIYLPILLDVFRLMCLSVLVGLFILCLWHGWSINIGQPGSGFYLHFESNALKDYFNGTL